VLIQEQDIEKAYLADVLLKGFATKPYQVDVLLKGSALKSYQADVIIGVLAKTYVYVDLYATLGVRELYASSGKAVLYAKKKWELELV